MNSEQKTISLAAWRPINTGTLIEYSLIPDSNWGRSVRVWVRLKHSARSSNAFIIWPEDMLTEFRLSLYDLKTCSQSTGFNFHCKVSHTLLVLRDSTHWENFSLRSEWTSMACCWSFHLLYLSHQGFFVCLCVPPPSPSSLSTSLSLIRLLQQYFICLGSPKAQCSAPFLPKKWLSYLFLPQYNNGTNRRVAFTQRGCEETSRCCPNKCQGETGDNQEKSNTSCRRELNTDR